VTVRFVRLSLRLFVCLLRCLFVLLFAESNEVSGDNRFRDQYTEHNGQREDPLSDVVREQRLQSDGVRTVREENDRNTIHKPRIRRTSRTLSAESIPQDRPTRQEEGSLD